MARPYVPSGGAEPGAIVVLAGAALGAAIVGGAVEGFVSRWLNLLIVFPLLLGLAVGAVGAKFVTSRKIRRPLAVGVIGVVTGLIAQATVHEIHYLHARSIVAEHIQKDPAAAPFVQAHGIDAAVDAALSGSEAGSPFLGYLHIAAENGITITHLGSDNGPHLTGIATYLLWLVELLASAIAAASMLVFQAREPFCESCNAWYSTRKTIATGAGDGRASKATVERFQKGAIADAWKNLGKSDGKSALTLTLRGCGTCTKHEPMIVVLRITDIGRKQKQKQVCALLLTPDEAKELEPIAATAAA